MATNRTNPIANISNPYDRMDAAADCTDFVLASLVRDTRTADDRKGHGIERLRVLSGARGYRLQRYAQGWRTVANTDLMDTILTDYDHTALAKRARGHRNSYQHLN